MKSRFLAVNKAILLLGGVVLSDVGCFGADQIPTQRELKQLLSNAKTAEDFQRLARHFEARAAFVDPNGAPATKAKADDKRAKMGAMMVTCEEKMKGNEAAKPAAEATPPAAAHQH